MPLKKEKTEASFLPDRLTDHDISLKKLSFGLWYLRNRRLFLNILIAGLIILSASGWIYSFYGLGRYFIFDREKDRQSLLEMAQTGVNLLAGRTNKPLSIGDVKILGNNPSNLIAEIHNPNERTVVSFRYSFIANEQAVIQREGFILPGQNRYLVALNQNIPIGSSVYLRIDQAYWQRLSAREIPDWPAFLADHNQLVIADRQVSLANGSNQLVSQIKFRLENRSAYGYWSVPILIMAYRGDSLVDINELVLSKLKSGEIRDINFSWPGLTGADRLEIMPIIDFLDQGNYLPVEK